MPKARELLLVGGLIALVIAAAIAAQYDRRDPGPSRALLRRSARVLAANSFSLDVRVPGKATGEDRDVVVFESPKCGDDMERELLFLGARRALRGLGFRRLECRYAFLRGAVDLRP